jgi:hypothetical protein
MGLIRAKSAIGSTALGSRTPARTPAGDVL